MALEAKQENKARSKSFVAAYVGKEKAKEEEIKRDGFLIDR